MDKGAIIRLHNNQILLNSSFQNTILSITKLFSFYSGRQLRHS
ncbi:hypothetical protein CEV33_0840 [Brucella grignonensis]|uniref:Uncharacterized protein n=1 Tax=Brucella grignonensis TaxID=94627 RepID=A0A256FE19_9HYPH|nr:hypothetical protein CEV33_0840 [Brucella grignonensis]